MPTSEGTKRQDADAYVQRVVGISPPVQPEVGLLVHGVILVAVRLVCAGVIVMACASVAALVGGVVAWSMAGIVGGLLASLATHHRESERKP